MCEVDRVNNILYECNYKVSLFVTVYQIFAVEMCMNSSFRLEDILMIFDTQQVPHAPMNRNGGTFDLVILRLSRDRVASVLMYRTSYELMDKSAGNYVRRRASHLAAAESHNLEQAQQESIQVDYHQLSFVWQHLTVRNGRWQFWTSYKCYPAAIRKIAVQCQHYSSWMNQKCRDLHRRLRMLERR